MIELAQAVEKASETLALAIIVASIIISVIGFDNSVELKSIASAMDKLARAIENAVAQSKNR